MTSRHLSTRPCAETVFIVHLLVNSNRKSPWFEFTYKEIQDLCAYSYLSGAIAFVKRMEQRGLIEVDRSGHKNKYRLTLKGQQL